jgi:hypothetical protein
MIIAMITIITKTTIIPETLHCFLWLAAASMHPASTVGFPHTPTLNACLACSPLAASSHVKGLTFVCVCVYLCVHVSFCLWLCRCLCLSRSLCCRALSPPPPHPPYPSRASAGGSPWRVTIASGCRSGAVVFPCLGRGMCLRSGACECSGGYLGASCQVACPGLSEEGTYCSGRGNCSSVKGDEDHGLLAICTCEYGVVHVCVCVCLFLCV